MDFRILGPIEVVDGDRVVPLPARKVRILLTLLLLQPRKVVATDRLIDDIWAGRPPPSARNALQNYVFQLRRAIGPERVIRREPGYLLDVAPEEIDLGRFDLAVARARTTTGDEERASVLREALALWRGEPFADLDDEPFTLVERPPILARRLSAQEDLIDIELSLDRHAQVLDELETLAEANVYDERLQCQLMLALYRSGRQTDALAVFTRVRSALVEIGLEPGPELKARHHAVLNHDPGLLLPRPSVTVDEPRRKTVTVFFAGVAEPARDELDPERVGLLGDLVVRETAAAAMRHGGTAERVPDGSAMAVFGVPEAHEDDALRAVKAACELRDSLRGHGLTARLGISTGEVIVAGTGGGAIAGATVGGARALEQAAPAGEILLGAQALQLVRGAVTAEPHEPAATIVGTPAFRLLTVVEGAPPIERHLDAPLVGRAAELAALRAAFEQARVEGRCRIVTILGEAGIGKTRLSMELCSGVEDDATVLVGRCVSYGQGATYLPVSDIVAQAGDDLETVLAGAGSIGEEHLILRGYFESVAAARPVLLVLEDIHWAEPSLLDLVESFAEHAVEAPMLILCLARPDLLDKRPGWPFELELGPLARGDVVALLGQIPVGVGEEDTARIADIAEGNALYAEQLLAYSEEGGSLESVPPSVEALLMSRLDRLQSDERSLLQRAAVVGREFDRSTLARLAAPQPPAAVDSRLSELEGAGLVHRTSRHGYQFQHVLIRDVAYAGLPKTQRWELHERLGAAIDGDQAGSDEVVGYHLEQACRYASELAAPADRLRDLGTGAGTRLAAAGIRASKRGDTPAAVNLLRRARALLPDDDPVGLELGCELGVALRAAGELQEAADVLAAGAGAARAAADRRAELRARLELANVRLLRDPGRGAGELLATAERAIPVFEAAGDHRSLSRAWRLKGYVQGALTCQYALSVEAAELALGHCEQSGWSTAGFLGDLAASLYNGPTPVDAGIRRCRELLKGADLGGEASVLAHIGGLEAMRGHIDEGRRLVARSRSLYQDIGQAALAEENCGEVIGIVELLGDDPKAAARAFRASCDALESIGGRAYLATRATQLAEALYLTGRKDEAAEWSRLAEESAAPDDIPTQFLWRSIQAKLLASDGRHERAETLAQEARDLAERTDALNQRGQVALGLAEVLRLRGRDDEARAAASEALGFFEQKGNTVAAARVRALLGS